MHRRLNPELLAYILLAVVAFALRAVASSRSLLGHEEAVRALAAWGFVQGQAPEPSWPLSPALLGLQSLAFFLFGAGDLTARLLALLAGALIPLAFFPLRNILGKDKALVAAVISAFSPLWFFSSSLADGEAAGVLAVLAAVGMFLRYREARDALWLCGAACALGFGMTTGLSIWTLLGEGVILALILRGKLRSLEFKPGARFWIALGASFFLSSTLLFFYPPGFGLAADSLARWLSAIFGGRLSIRPLLILILYEPLLLLAAVWGRESYSLLAPAGFGLAVAILGGLTGPAGLLPVLLPLTILSASGLCELFRGFTREKFRLEEAVALGLTFCVGVWGFLGMASYTLVGDLRYLLVIAGAFVGVATILTVLGVMHGPSAPARVFLMLLLLVLSLWEVKLSRGLNFTPYVEDHLPRSQFTSPDVAEVLRSLRKLSSYRSGDPTALDLALVGEIPELRWYLRDFSGLKVVGEGQTLPEAEAIIVPAEESVFPGENYMGRRFRVREKCRIERLRGSQLLRWLLYREPIAPREGEKAILWVKTVGRRP